jgi:hypothetical protein
MSTNEATFRKYNLHISVTSVTLEFTLLFKHVKTVNIYVVWRQHLIILHTEMGPNITRYVRMISHLWRSVTMILICPAIHRRPLQYLKPMCNCTYK